MDEKLVSKLCFAFSAMLGWFYVNEEDKYWHDVFRKLFTDEEYEQIQEHKKYPF